MCFFQFRQQGGNTIQGLLSQKPEKVSKHMVKWAQSITLESIVLVEGVIQAAPEPIKSCSVKDAEIMINKVCLSIALLFVGVSIDADYYMTSRSTPSQRLLL